MENNLKFKLKATDGSTFTLEVDVPAGSDTAEFLREIQASHHLVENSFEWLFEGWGLANDMKITPLMIAATIEKEANSYRHDAISPDIHKDVRERGWAQTHALFLLGTTIRICELEAQRLKSISVPVLA